MHWEGCATNGASLSSFKIDADFKITDQQMCKTGIYLFHLIFYTRFNFHATHHKNLSIFQSKYICYPLGLE